MKKVFLLIVTLCSFSTAFAQDNELIGEWRVVSIDDGGVYWNNKKDSVSISEKVKQTYKTKVGLQDRIASTRAGFSHCRFVFEADGSYREYFGTIENTLLFSGTYIVDNAKEKITAVVKSTTGYSLVKDMEYKIQDGLLFLNKDNKITDRNKFVLEKVK